LISPNEKIGCVLFYVQDEDTQQPSCDGGDKFFPRPSNIKVYDNNKGILKGTNSGKAPQYLWASVNDMLIMDTTENTKLAYIGSGLKADDLRKKTNKWNNIIKTNYRKLWFDDNIGDYIISIEVGE